jgi:hypothetical protein
MGKPEMHKGEPCVKCGYTWYFSMILLDPDAEELPVFSVCVNCRHSPDYPKTAGAPTGSATP